MQNLIMELWGDSYTPEIYSFFMTVFLLLLILTILKVIIIIALSNR